MPVRLAIEQADGSVFRFDIAVLPDSHPQAAANTRYLERFVKFLLWSRGGWRIYLDGPAALARGLAAHYADTATGRFDADLVGERMFDHPIEVVHTAELPPERSETKPLGRHLDGCRIGFDLGGSDRKVAAVIDGKVVFSEETVWDPYHKPDPQYHFDGIMDSLRKAAAHLPRVDAIGGSAAGVYVNNRVKAGSLFRGVPPDVFDRRVRDLFLEIRRAWGDVPFEVVNDGEVTALAGSMSLGENAMLGIALGTSTAAGYVTRDGNITSWLNELAFVPIDFNPAGPVDEWSGDYGVGSQYFSQQCVGRLHAAGRHRRAGRHAAAREAEARAVADGRAAIPRAEDLRDDRHVPRVRRRALRRLLRPAARARARPRDLRAPAATTSSTAPVPCSTTSFPSWPSASSSTCPTSRTSVTARRSPPPAFLRSALSPMNPYRHSSTEIARLVREGKTVSARRLPHACAPAAARHAPKALIFSPHPDDECIIGGLALRLLREAGMRVVNVAVTQGSKKERQAARWDELRAACDYLGFDLVATVPGGLEKINVRTRQRTPPLGGVGRGDRGHPRPEQPRVVFFPHETDWNSTHIGTHHLLVDALARQPAAFTCTASRRSSGARWRRRT